MGTSPSRGRLVVESTRSALSEFLTEGVIHVERAGAANDNLREVPLAKTPTSARTGAFFATSAQIVIRRARTLLHG